MKKTGAERYRNIDFSDAKRGPAVQPEPGKTKISIRLDNTVLDYFRGVVDKAGGGNYQTLINEALLEHVHRRSTLDVVPTAGSGASRNHAAVTERAKDLSTALPAESSRLESNVLVRRRVRIRGDQGEGRLLYLGSHASNESIFPDRSEHDAIVEDPLDLVE